MPGTRQPTSHHSGRGYAVPRQASAPAVAIPFQRQRRLRLHRRAEHARGHCEGACIPTVSERYIQILNLLPTPAAHCTPSRSRAAVPRFSVSETVAVLASPESFMPSAVPFTEQPAQAGLLQAGIGSVQFKPWSDGDAQKGRPMVLVEAANERAHRSARRPFPVTPVSTIETALVIGVLGANRRISMVDLLGTTICSKTPITNAVSTVTTGVTGKKDGQKSASRSPPQPIPLVFPFWVSPSDLGLNCMGPTPA